MDPAKPPKSFAPQYSRVKLDARTHGGAAGRALPTAPRRPNEAARGGRRPPPAQHTIRLPRSAPYSQAPAALPLPLRAVFTAPVATPPPPRGLVPSSIASLLLFAA